MRCRLAPLSSNRCGIGLTGRQVNPCIIKNMFEYTWIIFPENP